MINKRCSAASAFSRTSEISTVRYLSTVDTRFSIGSVKNRLRLSRQRHGTACKSQTLQPTPSTPVIAYRDGVQFVSNTRRTVVKRGQERSRGNMVPPPFALLPYWAIKTFHGMHLSGSLCRYTVLRVDMGQARQRNSVRLSRCHGPGRRYDDPQLSAKHVDRASRGDSRCLRL